MTLRSGLCHLELATPLRGVASTMNWRRRFCKSATATKWRGYIALVVLHKSSGVPIRWQRRRLPSSKSPLHRFACQQMRMQEPSTSFRQAKWGRALGRGGTPLTIRTGACIRLSSQYARVLARTSARFERSSPKFALFMSSPYLANKAATVFRFVTL